MSNLWLLGGEIISRIQHDPELVGFGGRELVLRFVDEEGGRLSRHLSTEEVQKKLDSTCRRLYRFLTQEPG